MSDRKDIPKALRDKLLVDAMHRCCLCPEHHDLTDMHHIVPVNEKGPDTEDNLMAVCGTCHDKIHRLRTQYNAEQLRIYKERWVSLCALGLPLDLRLAQASDYTKPPSVLPFLPSQPCFAHPHPLQENFTGRVHERQMLTGWLANDNRPLLALIAIGGMGKSSLTWAWMQRDVLGFPLPGVSQDPPEVCDACRVPEDARPEGVLWWSFYEREGQFVSFIDRALAYAGQDTVDVRAIPSTRDKVDKLLELLQQRRLLLVLDGFERELRGYATLNAAYQDDAAEENAHGDFRTCTDPNAAVFLRHAASMPLTSSVLLTTRHLPKDLDGLAGCRRYAPEGLAPDDAAAFMLAQGVIGGRSEIDEACRAYRYHPLSLRLLSRFIIRDKKTPGDVRAAGRYPIVPELVGKEQHHILQVACGALEPWTFGLLCRIAALRGPAPYETLAVFRDKRRESDFEAALEELIDRGLLLVDSARGRYDLHPVVRRYAYEALPLHYKRKAHDRLRDHFSTAPAPELRKVRSLQDLAPTIELYHHTVHAGLYDEALKLYRDRLTEALYYHLGAYETDMELKMALFPDGDDQQPRLRSEHDQAWMLNALANSYSASGQPRRAVSLFEMGGGIHGETRDKGDLAVRLSNIAHQQTVLGQFDAAGGNLHRSIELWHAADDPREAVGHAELGRLLTYEGSFAESAGKLSNALAWFRRLGQVQAESIGTAHQALFALLKGQASAAIVAARRARELADKTARARHPFESDYVRAEWLWGAALVALAADQPNRADEYLAQAGVHLTDALTRCRRINLVELEPDILLSWAHWHRLKGNSREAHEHATEALLIAERCEYRLCQADIRNFLARLALDDGDREGAREHAEMAMERALCDGPPHYYKPAYEEAERLLREIEA